MLFIRSDNYYNLELLVFMPLLSRVVVGLGYYSTGLHLGVNYMKLEGFYLAYFEMSGPRIA